MKRITALTSLIALFIGLSNAAMAQNMITSVAAAPISPAQGACFNAAISGTATFNVVTSGGFGFQGDAVHRPRIHFDTIRRSRWDGDRRPNHFR